MAESQPNKILSYIIYGLLILVLALSVYIVLDKSERILLIDKEKHLKDSLLLLKQEVEKSHYRQDVLEKAYDSLRAIDPEVITRTRDKIKFIYTANPSELDSVIRATWKTSSRYN